MGMVLTVWVCIADYAPKKEGKKVRRVFYSKISHRSYYAQHFTCTQNLAMHSMFNIKKFNAGF